MVAHSLDIYKTVPLHVSAYQLTFDLTSSSAVFIRQKAQTFKVVSGISSSISFARRKGIYGVAT